MDPDAQDWQPADARKKRSRIIVIVLVLTLLLLLAGGGFVGFEGLRQKAIAGQIDSLRAAEAALSRDILHDRTPVQFYQDRARGGRNGYEHEKRAQACCEDLFSMTPEELEALGVKPGASFKSPWDVCEFFSIREDYTLEDLGDDRPSDAELKNMLMRSQPVLDAVREAAAADFIAFAPDPVDPWGDSTLNVLLRLRVIQTLRARIDAYRLSGDFARASAEALLAVQFAERHTQPANLVWSLVDLAHRDTAWRLAAELARTGKLSAECLRAKWPDMPAREQFFESAIEADCVFIWSFTQAHTLMKDDPWFDWVAGGTKHPVLADAPNTPWAPINMRREIARGLALTLTQLQEFRSSADKFKWDQYSAPEGDSIIAYDVARMYAKVCSCFVKLHQLQAVIRLRRAELDAGPLPGQPAAIARIAAALDDIHVEIQGFEAVVSADRKFWQQLAVRDSVDLPPEIRLRPLRR